MLHVIMIRIPFSFTETCKFGTKYRKLTRFKKAFRKQCNLIRDEMIM